MGTNEISTYLKYANLQMAAEAFLVNPKTASAYALDYPSPARGEGLLVYRPTPSLALLNRCRINL